MPKIYETQQDFEREKLHQQAHMLRGEAGGHDSASWMMLLGGFATSLVNLTRQKSSFLLTVLADSLMIGGIIEWYRASKAHGKAKDLRLEAERIPHSGNAVILDELAQQPAPHDCGCHKHTKGHAKTLLEHAQPNKEPTTIERG